MGRKSCARIDHRRNAGKAFLLVAPPAAGDDQVVLQELRLAGDHFRPEFLGRVRSLLKSDEAGCDPVLVDWVRERVDAALAPWAEWIEIDAAVDAVVDVGHIKRKERIARGREIDFEKRGIAIFGSPIAPIGGDRIVAEPRIALSQIQSVSGDHADLVPDSVLSRRPGVAFDIAATEVGIRLAIRLHGIGVGSDIIGVGPNRIRDQPVGLLAIAGEFDLKVAEALLDEEAPGPEHTVDAVPGSADIALEREDGEISERTRESHRR